MTAGGASPLYYQWRFNGAGLGGATNSAYSITNVQAGNAGNYAVVVTNSFGSVTSQAATLTVVTPPEITTQPQSQTNLAGATVGFAVGGRRERTAGLPVALQRRQPRGRH